MEVRRCMKCMHPLTAGETVCPECGRAYGSANAETFALKPGTILEGKYLVGEMLGQGGFGITYIGFDLLLEQKVAIKEYYPMSTGMVSREGHSTVVWSSAMMGKIGCLSNPLYHNGLLCTLCGQRGSGRGGGAGVGFVAHRLSFQR